MVIQEGCEIQTGILIVKVLILYGLHVSYINITKPFKIFIQLISLFYNGLLSSFLNAEA